MSGGFWGVLESDRGGMIVSKGLAAGCTGIWRRILS